MDEQKLFEQADYLIKLSQQLKLATTQLSTLELLRAKKDIEAITYYLNEGILSTLYEIIENVRMEMVEVSSALLPEEEEQ